MELPFTVVIPDFRCSIPKLSNLNLLEISLTMFFLFVLAEVCGALLSNSLSLLGDAASMSIDVMTYICNIYGEWAKSSNQRPTVRSRLILEVIIPGLSTVALLAITFYICMDAVHVLQNPPATNDVNTNYLYGFAATNLCIDLLCGTLFYMRGDEVFVESDSLPKLSLDTSVTFDQEEDDFGHLEDDLDGYMNSPNSSTTTWNPFTSSAGAGGGSKDSYVPIGGSATATAKRGVTHTHGGCCTNAVTLWKNFFSVRALACCYCCCSAGAAGREVSGNQRGQGGEGTAIAQSSQAHSHSHGGRKNLNMMSAFTHIIGDTLRTISMFVAASVATITGIDGDICDAYAALVVTFTIVVLCTSLVLDIWAAASDIWYEEYTEIGYSGNSSSSNSGGRGARNARKYASISNSAYSRVSDNDDADGETDGEEGIEMR